MVVAMDYDGTYTLDPNVWQMILNRLKMSGHTVYLVTMRTPEECIDLCPDLVKIVDDVIPTSRKAKMPFVRNLGIKIDVWIDDRPDWIFSDSF